MKVVYCIEFHDWEGDYTIGIFSMKEKAEAYLKEFLNKYPPGCDLTPDPCPGYSIEEVTLDPSIDELKD